jgi:hypothetical protein
MIRRSMLLLVVISYAVIASAEDTFRVWPYVQNPSSDSMTVRWLSGADEPGALIVDMPDGPRTLRSQPTLARPLEYNPFKPEPGGPHPALPWLHSVRVTGLKPGTKYAYHVRQGAQQHAGAFQTAPSPDQPIRFIVYSDPETEPESTTSPPVDCPPSVGKHRPQVSSPPSFRNRDGRGFAFGASAQRGDGTD